MLLLKHKSAVGRDSAYITDFMHNCKAPQSPSLSASPTGRCYTQQHHHQPHQPHQLQHYPLPDNISAKSDADASSSGGGYGDKKDFGRSGSSSGGGSGRRSTRSRSRRGAAAAANAVVGVANGLQCVSCSVLVAIAAVTLLLGLAIALSVADVDVVASWFGGGRGGIRSGASDSHRMRVVRRVLQKTPLIGRYFLCCVCVCECAGTCVRNMQYSYR